MLASLSAIFRHISGVWFQSALGFRPTRRRPPRKINRENSDNPHHFYSPAARALPTKFRTL